MSGCCEICSMTDAEITDFINTHLEFIDKNLRRDIAVSIENYIVQNDLIVDIAGNVIDIKDDESKDDESEEEEASKKSLVITKKNGKTRIVINI